MKTRTVGVEEEFLLFAADRPALAEIGPGVVESAERSAADDVQFEKELKKAQVELASAALTDLRELARELADRREELGDAARRRGARLVASGTSPVAHRAATTDQQRYRQMSQRFAAIEDHQLTCAMHVHVEIESDDEGVRVLDGIAPWLPVLTALTANSPFDAGADTGYASYRTILWGRWPTAGPAGSFPDGAAYRRTVGELVASGAARDDAMIYFDARLSANYPTVEIRVCDVCMDPAEAVTIAALCRGLVATAAGEDGGGPAVRPELLRAGSWRAARWGMSGDLVDLTRATGAGALAPAWDLADALVDHVSAALAAADDLDRVRAGLARLRRRGTGADRQRAADGLAGAVDAATVRPRD